MWTIANALTMSIRSYGQQRIHKWGEVASTYRTFEFIDVTDPVSESSLSIVGLTSTMIIKKTRKRFSQESSLLTSH